MKRQRISDRIRIAILENEVLDLAEQQANCPHPVTIQGTEGQGVGYLYWVCDVCSKMKTVGMYY